MKTMMEGTRIVISFLFFLFVVFFPFISTSTISIEPDVQTWGLTNITYWNDDATAWHYAFPGAGRMANGDSVRFYVNNTYHNVYGKIHVLVSHDNGITWDAPYLYSAYGCPPGVVGITSNGIALYTDAYNLMMSYDNGTNGSWVDMGTYLPSNWYGQAFNLVGHTLYSCAYYAGTSVPSLWKSTDNGTNWESVSFLDDYAPANLKKGGEWDFIALNDTHFLTIADSDYGTPHPDITIQCESFDAGVTWTNYENVFSEIGEINKPELSWLNYDQGVIILTGRNYTSTCIETRWVTTDNGTTWQNNSNIDFPVPYPDFVDGDYGQVIEFLEDNKVLRVTFWGDVDDRNDIWTVWYGDNATYPSQNTAIQFISIDGGTNGTVFQTTTPTFNGTMPENTSTIWLQVSDSYTNWTDSHLVVNLSNISESEFPSHFTAINSTHWSFTLPEAYAISPIKWFYCRFETYTLG